MYPVSEAYKEAIKKDVRNVKITGTITLKDNTIINITDEDLVLGSLYITEQCVSGEDIEVGNVYASEMGLSLTTQLENPYSLDGARVLLRFGIDVSDDGTGIWEYVPLGYYYVTDIARKAGNVDLIAIDGMLLFDVPIGEPGSSSPRSLIVYACEKAGIMLGSSIADIDALPNAGILLSAPDASKIKTARDLLMWACQITGSFARMNRQGQLEIVPIAARESVKTIEKKERFNSDTSDFAVKITKLAMQVGENEYSRGIDGMTMVLEENPLMAGLDENQINQILDNLLSQITQAVYVPFQSDFMGDPALQPGDYITLADTSVLDGGDIASIITHSTWRYSGGHNIKAAGKSGIVRGVENQQVKAVNSIVAIARAAQDLALAANQSTQLIKDAIGGHVLIRQSPDETNEILIMDHPDPDQATKIWRWNMGGLGYSDNCVGADNPDREYDIAMTMDGAINANFIKTGSLDAGVVTIGPETTFAEGFLPALMKVQGITPGTGADQNCTALYHFDGGLAPAIGPNATFTRASVAYLEDGTQVASGQPRFEPGKFGKGILIEEGTTNLLSANQSSIETDLTGLSGSSVGATISRDTNEYYYGSASVKVITDGSTTWDGVRTSVVPVASSMTYTASAWVKVPAGASMRITIAEYSGDPVTLIGETAVVFVASGEWQRVEATREFGPTGENVRMVVANVGSIAHTFYVDGLQIEQKPYATSWQLGGTARAGEFFTIPTTVLSPSQGTISFWVNVNDRFKMQGVGYTYLLRVQGAVGDAFCVYHSNLLAGMYLRSWDESGNFSMTPLIDDSLIPNGWHMFTVTWSTTRMALYIDGQLAGSVANPYLQSSLGESMYLGYHVEANLPNTVFDELRIDKVARTDEEIAAWYEADAPFWVKADLDALPGYLKLEPDGIKVYDPNDALRVLLGSWLSDAVRKYGLKIIGGEIYSSQIFTGKEGDTSYAYLGPVTDFFTYPFGMKLNGKNLFEIMSHSRGPIMNFYDPYYNNMVGQITTMDDAMGQGLRIQARNNLGYNTDLNMRGKWVTVDSSDQFYVDADNTILLRSPYQITLSGDTHVSGDLTKSGTLNYVEPTKDYGIRLLNALEGPELKYVDMGRAQLENGEATVYLDPILLQCIEPDTDLTPWLFKTEVYGEGEDIRVIEWGGNYFRVKECNNGTSNRKFGWWFYATRINYAGIRLQEYVAGVV